MAANLLFVNVKIPTPKLSSLQSSCFILFSPFSMIDFYSILLNITLMKLIQKGAEADIYQTKWQTSKAILKIRKTKIKIAKNFEVDRLIIFSSKDVNNIVFRQIALNSVTCKGNRDRKPVKNYCA